MANDNELWYENIIRKGTLRSSGVDEIAEENPLDWKRLRRLENGKLVPAIPGNHSGKPKIIDLDLLQDAAEKGELFLYRLGEEYPMRLVDGVWYSTDPAAAQEKKPELNLPEGPKEPGAFTATLESELTQRELEPNVNREDLLGNEDALRRYDEAAAALESKRTAHQRAQEAYQTAQNQYIAETERLNKAHEEKVKAWEKRTAIWSGLDIDTKRAIRNEMEVRREEISTNQEKRQADAVDAPPFMEWYNNEFGRSVFRPGKGPNPAGNAMDWSQVRIWDGEKFTQAMPEGHRGTPDVSGLKRIREAAKGGNLFFLRRGDEYPQQLVDGVWYDTDPAAALEAKPTLTLPQAPKEPEPFAATLENELTQRNLAADAKWENLQNEKDRQRYDEAVAALASKKEAHEKAREEYRTQKQQYDTECDRLQQVYEKAVEDWEKRIDFYGHLNEGVKQAIEHGMPQRREEIERDREQQRADMNRQSLGRWYNSEFRQNIVQPSKDPKLADTDGIEWGRVRIWDGQKFARVLPEWHKGIPDDQALKKLQDAAEKGNLFMYQRGDKYPSKWMGNHWLSMDRGWIEASKPVEPEELTKDLGHPLRTRPTLDEYTKEVSGVKLALNRAFGRVGIKVYRGEVEKYNQAVEKHARARDKYDRDMAAYFEKREERDVIRNEFNRRVEAHEYMRKSYEALTPEQRAAMENDVQQRLEEIKANREVERQNAEAKLGPELNAKARIARAAVRIDAMTNEPEHETFLNRGDEPLGQEAYDTIAPHGYALPVDSRLEPAEMAAIHVVVAGSPQAAEQAKLPLPDAAQYGQMLQGVFYGKSTDVNWQYITASYDTTKGLIAEYENGNPEPLAKAVGEGMRNLINVGRGHMDMSPEMAGLAQLTERMLNVMDTHKGLMEHCNLTQEEMNFARGMVNLGRIYNQFLDARTELVMAATGAQKLSPEEMNKHTANLLIGKMAESRLKQEKLGLERPVLVQNLGKGNGKALETVQNIYQNAPNVQQFVKDPQNQKQTDLDKRVQNLAGIVGNSPLAKPKESAQLREQIHNLVKNQLQQDNKQAAEAAKLAEELEIVERQQVRHMLGQQDSRYERISLRNDLVTEKLNELRQAREVLEKADPAQKLELTDERVQREALERASVRDLLKRENGGRKVGGENGIEMEEFALQRRMRELREAQKQLETESGKTQDLTSDAVVQKAAENRLKRAEQLRKPVTEMLQAQSVYVEETGVEPVPNGKTPFYRSEVVTKRRKELEKAREDLGEAHKDLPLNDMRVIQQDYLNRGVDPLVKGIVDVERLTERQQKMYYDRMEVIDYLREVRGRTELYKNTSRYHGLVETNLTNLNQARQDYEFLGGEAERNLKLNDPKIIAMHLFNTVQMGERVKTKVSLEDVHKLSREIQGKTYWDADRICRQQLEGIQERQRQAQAQQQQQQQQVQQAPR